uniref:Uncharacterized protein n=1 Tax=viral metagenome TaxID=1070528 RepID=A0A6C0LXY2_9ZZZZ
MSDYYDDEYGGGEYGEGLFDGDQGSENEWEQDLQAYEDNFNDGARAGEEYTGCWETGKGGEKLKIQTPLGRFCIKVDAVSRNIESECNLLNQADITMLQSFSQKVPRVRYKNPTAFVLGYIATKRGASKIDIQTLETVYNCYKKTVSVDKDESVKKSDVIRYARLWNILTKQ